MIMAVLILVFFLKEKCELNMKLSVLWVELDQMTSRGAFQPKLFNNDKTF